MIRVAFLDDHASVRAGLEAIAAAAPGLTSVGTAADAAELRALLRRTQPDVVVLDVDHPGDDGLLLALRIKRQVPAPRVVLHTSRPAAELSVPALAARADAVVGKDEPADALVAVIRDVAGGRAVPPIVTPREMTRASARLDPTDRAILAMRLAGTTATDTAAAIGLTRRAVAERTQGIVARLLAPRAPGAPGTA